jgi:hypothetical protein
MFPQTRLQRILLHYYSVESRVNDRQNRSEVNVRNRSMTKKRHRSLQKLPITQQQSGQNVTAVQIELFIIIPLLMFYIEEGYVFRVVVVHILNI